MASIPKYFAMTTRYKVNTHKRVNAIKLRFVFCIGWLLNRLFGLKIEMELVDGKSKYKEIGDKCEETDD